MSSDGTTRVRPMAGHTTKERAPRYWTVTEPPWCGRTASNDGTTLARPSQPTTTAYLATPRVRVTSRALPLGVTMGVTRGRSTCPRDCPAVRSSRSARSALRFRCVRIGIGRRREPLASRSSGVERYVPARTLRGRVTRVLLAEIPSQPLRVDTEFGSERLRRDGRSYRRHVARCITHTHNGTGWGVTRQGLTYPIPYASDASRITSITSRVCQIARMLYIVPPPPVGTYGSVCACPSKTAQNLPDF